MDFKTLEDFYELKPYQLSVKVIGELFSHLHKHVTLMINQAFTLDPNSVEQQYTLVMSDVINSQSTVWALAFEYDLFNDRYMEYFKSLLSRNTPWARITLDRNASDDNRSISIIVHAERIPESLPPTHRFDRVVHIYHHAVNETSQLIVSFKSQYDAFLNVKTHALSKKIELMVVSKATNNPVFTKVSLVGLYDTEPRSEQKHLLELAVKTDKVLSQVSLDDYHVYVIY